MDKEISADVKKLGTPERRLLIRGLIILFITATSLFLKSVYDRIKDLEDSNAKAWRQVSIKDSLYNDCGMQRLTDSKKTLEEMQKTDKKNDSIKNLINKVK